MAGDLLSSFTKRRMRLASSSMAPGIDQVPESVLPLTCRFRALQLTLLDVLMRRRIVLGRGAHRVPAPLHRWEFATVPTS